MATIVIFDDEAQSIAHIRSMVERLIPGTEKATILEAQSLDQLVAIIKSSVRIDILIADITMPEGQPSGIEVVQRFFPPESGTQVIYASGFLDQATEVYRTPHLYFLLKPIDAQKLEDSLERAFAALAQRRPQMLRVKTGRKEQLINAASISYLESRGHRVIVHCRSEVIETYAKLSDLERQLPDSFSRCHNSYLVNLAFVSSLGESALHLHDGTALPISRRRMQQVQHDLLAYLAR